MKVVFDGSAFAKRYVDEAGSQRVDDILQQASALGLCILCVPEIVSALNRRLREGAITATGYAQAKTRLGEDVGDALLLNLTSSVVVRSIELLETNVLRAMDALHIACALEWQADLFVSADQRQLVAARRADLRTEQV